MAREKNPVIARLDRRGMTRRIQELTGMNARTAENAINAVAYAMSTWLQGIIRDIPWGSEARLTITGLGQMTIKYVQPRAKRWRTAAGIPQQPALITLTYTPAKAIADEIIKANKPIKEEYLKQYRPAIQAYRAEHPFQLRTRFTPAEPAIIPEQNAPPISNEPIEEIPTTSPDQIPNDPFPEASHLSPAQRFELAAQLAKLKARRQAPPSPPPASAITGAKIENAEIRHLYNESAIYIAEETESAGFSE